MVTIAQAQSGFMERRFCDFAVGDAFSTENRLYFKASETEAFCPETCCLIDNIRNDKRFYVTEAMICWKRVFCDKDLEDELDAEA